MKVMYNYIFKMNKLSPSLRYFYTFTVGYAINLIIDPSGNLLAYFSMFMILYGLMLGFNSASGKSYTGIILIIICIFVESSQFLQLYSFKLNFTNKIYFVTN